MAALDGVGELLESFRRRDARRLEELARLGVDLETRDAEGFTVLLRAAELGEPGALQWILEAGARLDVEAPWRGVAGRDALMLAAGCGHGGVVDLLLGAGADGRRRDAAGLRAIDLAAVAQHQAIVQRLSGASGEAPAQASQALAQQDLAPQDSTSQDLATEPVNDPEVLHRVDERGLGRFDGEDVCIMVRAAPHEVASWWQRHIGARVWQRDAYGDAIVVRGPSYLVFRFREHPWTILRAAHQSSDLGFDPSQAQALARELNCEAMFLLWSAAAGQVDARAFVGDRATWSVQWPTAQSQVATFGIDTLSDATADSLSDTFCDPFDDPFDDRFADIRLSRQAPVSELAALRQVDHRLRTVDAYAPSWGRLDGEVHRLEISGLAPSAFERMDFVGV